VSRTTTPTVSRRAGRREAILDAATTLFSTRGYADTGIDDIGEAVGITGPAVYRHFKSKQELLLATLERSVEHASTIAAIVESEERTPEEALRVHVDLTVRACIDDRALAVLYWQESRNLPSGPRKRLERRQRELIEEFAQVLTRVRTDLTPSEARMAVHSAASLMRAVATRESTLDDATMQRLLSSMAYASLIGAEPIG
jgi:AcrR family transcriptional regulator